MLVKEKNLSARLPQRTVNHFCERLRSLFLVCANGLFGVKGKGFTNSAASRAFRQRLHVRYAKHEAHGADDQGHGQPEPHEDLEDETTENKSVSEFHGCSPGIR